MPLTLRLHRRPQLRAIPVLAAMAVFAVAFAAGQWQSGRAAEKDRIEARHALAQDAPPLTLPSPGTPEQLDGRRARITGEFLQDKTVYLDNQVYNRMAGYHVLTPLRTASGATVLVNRGWIKTGASRAELPLAAAPTGVVSIEGRIALPPKNIYEIKPEAAPGRVWQNLLLPQIAQQAGIALPGFVLRQTSVAEDGLTRVWSAPVANAQQQGMTAAKHRGYAFQWYALAALTAFLFLFFTFIGYGEPSRNA